MGITPRCEYILGALEEEGEVAADYLEGLLDIADFDGDIDIDVENERASLSISGGKLGNLVGERGEVLDSLQELTRLAVQTSTGERSRLMLDIDNFRGGKKDELTKLAKEVAEELNIPLIIREKGEAYIDLVGAPSYGYGSQMNPCVDCRIYMFQMAEKVLIEVGAHFIVTGEVVGQRPLSQNKANIASLRNVQRVC